MSAPLAQRLAALIATTGPLSVAQYMAACLFDPRHGYYARGAGLGRDFTTAPEISQMFGELIGLWLVQSWLDLGAPDPVQVIELGPGRGAMMADAARAARVSPPFQAAAQLNLIEASEPLRAVQAQTLRKAGAAPSWITRIKDAPPGPCLIVANEFLDCLPIRQYVRQSAIWRERVVGRDPQTGALRFGLGAGFADAAMIPAPLAQAADGAIAEIRPGMAGVVDEIAERLAMAPGRALFIDYGGAASTPGDTLQALRAGERVDPLAFPGESDLTAHVDFGELRRLARASGLDVAGPKPQGAWLEALGIGLRAQALAQARPDQRAALSAAYDRLTSPTQMGTLFQAICLSSRGLPAPAGF